MKEEVEVTEAQEVDGTKKKKSSTSAADTTLDSEEKAEPEAIMKEEVEVTEAPPPGYPPHSAPPPDPPISSYPATSGQTHKNQQQLQALKQQPATSLTYQQRQALIHSKKSEEK